MKVIYVIINKLNGKRYVGSAKNFYKRRAKHFSDLFLNKHKNIHLQRSYNKYSKDFFEILILERIDVEDDLIPREQYYIDLIKPEYNINPVAGSWLGRKHNPESLEKMSLAKIGRKLSNETKLKMSSSAIGKSKSIETRSKMSSGRVYPILQLDLQGNLIKEWKNAAEAGRELNLDYRDLQRIAIQKINKSRKGGNFLWRYKS